MQATEAQAAARVLEDAVRQMDAMMQASCSRLHSALDGFDQRLANAEDSISKIGATDGSSVGPRDSGRESAAGSTLGPEIVGKDIGAMEAKLLGKVEELEAKMRSAEARLAFAKQSQLDNGNKADSESLGEKA
mmetsp:Transcript_6504/g.15022  ORF Transcript_6504/g.15022 Transcript_6504/m.15022 type:complete len:133 (+) Transcript_6504:38-436(+)|eukprot:CAMPEP_0114557832 /NCGR_PEP_ID=MMETSP0114-20121206/10045_1 /TAXON_ID=31324 /ORGANISM="Goniomonas sp, Strain m" /LENGTH=132 /DNA_ID=CAMNT_0001743155 /DNA_START=38 /DNA_END=436 /DNA_ORIENTATION=+